jgi:stage II sporulation protein GA (sporulation sigma-E factor processing peptidase)
MEEGSKMKIYGDLLWLLNFSFDFLLLWLTASLLRIQLGKAKTAIAAAMGASYSVLAIFPEWSLLFQNGMKLFFALIMIWITFQFRNLVYFLRCVATFYFVSFVVGGGIFAIHYFYLPSAQGIPGVLLVEDSTSTGTVMGSLVVIGFGCMWLFSRQTFRAVETKQQRSQWIVSVTVYCFDQVIKCKGLMDTGNQLVDPLTRTPVMILEINQLRDAVSPKLLAKLMSIDALTGMGHSEEEEDSVEDNQWVSRIRLIPYRGVNRGMNMMVAFKPDRIRLEETHSTYEMTRVLVGLDTGTLSKDGEYQAILHPSMMLQQTS